MKVARRTTALVLASALAVVLGSLQPGVPAERSEASTFLGGIAALPSALPAVAPIFDGSDFITTGVAQVLPAVAPASGPGSFAIVTAICMDTLGPPFNCPLNKAGDPTITFSMSKVYPPGGTVAATFTANGATTLLCTDDADCDLSDPTAENAIPLTQHVAVGLTGGGENEVISVEACDATGDCRSVLVMFIETYLAVPPLASGAAAEPIVVSYRCDDVGQYTRTAAESIVPIAQATPEVSWEEVFDWFYSSLSGLGLNSGALRPSADQPFYSCGGDTGSPLDDRVNFETDAGILTVDFLGDVGTLAQPLVSGGVPTFRPFGSLTTDCDAGDSVDILDGPGPVVDTRNWGTLGDIGLVPVPGDYCDLNFAPNGVVTYALMGTGESGVATVTGQQSGGGGVLRSINASFLGRAALSLMLETPEVIGVEGGEFSAAMVDASFRPLGGLTVQCAAKPVDAVLAIIPQTGTTGGIESENPGQVLFTLFPTRSAVETGLDVSIVCILDSNPDVKATATVRIGERKESVDLVKGCNPLAATWPDATPIDTVVTGVAPAEALDAIWLFDPASGAWQGYSPAAPEASDLEFVNNLDAIFVCMNAPGTVSRLVI